jgi:polar amino acid transport system substrate-binding protein
MGLKVSLSDAPFETLLPALPTGTYDVVMSALTSTTERAKSADFVTYYYEGDGLLVKGGNPKDLAVDASLCGVRVAVLKGSTQQSESVPLLDQGCTAARRPSVRAVEIAGAGGLATALSSGRVDAALTDRSNAAYTAEKSSGALAFAPGQPFNPAPFGVATPKGNGMAQAVQKALQRMIADGSYQQIVTKWGLQAGAVETPKINDVGD